jgi:hypothetical protein
MPSPPGQGNRSRMFASVAPREVLARLRRGVAKPQVKLLIGVSDPYTSAKPVAGGPQGHNDTDPFWLASGGEGAAHNFVRRAQD